MTALRKLRQLDYHSSYSHPGGHPNSSTCGHLKIPHLVSSRLVPS
jgi:hypothetical protein